ncbi:hypothetical protein [Bartonella tribocorum]|uniref:hypothetical protein n=1 Tax=Bartonella tribocorum TaxID=85701 RepID=UPI001ABAFF55|nr:hypothetical protein [Bartonella tribocorum]
MQCHYAFFRVSGGKITILGEKTEYNLKKYLEKNFNEAIFSKALNTVSYSFLQFPTVSYSFLQFPTVSYSFLQFPTVSYSFLQFPTVSYGCLRNERAVQRKTIFKWLYGAVQKGGYNGTFSIFYC